MPSSRDTVKEDGENKQSACWGPNFDAVSQKTKGTGGPEGASFSAKIDIFLEIQIYVLLNEW